MTNGGSRGSPPTDAIGSTAIDFSGAAFTDPLLRDFEQRGGEYGPSEKAVDGSTFGIEPLTALAA